MFEEGILQNRDEIRQKRVLTKDMTFKISNIKKDIESLNVKLEKKEEETHQGADVLLGLDF